MIIGFGKLIQAVGGTPASIVQIVKAYNSSDNTSFTGTTPIVVGSDANRAVLAFVCYGASSNTANTSASTATLAGVSMTKIGNIAEGGANRRPRIAVFALASPASGSSAIAFSAGNIVGATVWLVEVKDADQTLANWTFTGGATTNATARNVSITPPDDSVVIRGLSILSGDYSGEISANGAATLEDTGNTGTQALSDVTTAISSEDIVTGSANTNGFAWTTAADAVDVAVAVPPA